MKIVKPLLIIALSAGLVACAPTEFGMPKAQFDKLSNSQKQQVIAAYNQRQQQQAEVQPLVDALDMVGQEANLHKNMELSHSESSSMSPWSCQGGTCSRSGHSSSSSTSVGVGF